MNSIRLILLSIFTWVSMFAYAQRVTDSSFVFQKLLKNIQQAQCIVEGEVLSSHSYYAPDSSMIYTRHTIEIIQVWKEFESKSFQKGNIIEVVTQGGRVGKDGINVSHEVAYPNGAVGIMFLDLSVYPNDSTSHIQSGSTFSTHNGVFIDYDFSSGTIQANYGSIHFDCIGNLYEMIDPNYVNDCL